MSLLLLLIVVVLALPPTLASSSIATAAHSASTSTGRPSAPWLRSIGTTHRPANPSVLHQLQLPQQQSAQTQTQQRRQHDRRLQKWVPEKASDVDCESYLSETATTTLPPGGRRLDGGYGLLAQLYYSVTGSSGSSASGNVNVNVNLSTRQAASTEPPLPCRETNYSNHNTNGTGYLDSFPSAAAATTTATTFAATEPAAAAAATTQSTTVTSYNYMPKQDGPADANSNSVQVSISVALPATWNPTDVIHNADHQAQSDVTATHYSLAALLSTHVGSSVTQLFHSTLQYAIDMLQTNAGDTWGASDQQQQQLLQELQAAGVSSQLPQEDLYQWILQYLDLLDNDNADNTSPMLEELKTQLRMTLHALLFENNNNSSNNNSNSDNTGNKDDGRWEMFLRDVHMELVMETNDYAWWTFTMEYPVYAYNDTTTYVDSEENATSGATHASSTGTGDWMPVVDQNTLDFLMRLLDRVLQGATMSGAMLTSLRDQVQQELDLAAQSPSKGQHNGDSAESLVWAVAVPGKEFPLDGSAPDGSTPPINIPTGYAPRPLRPPGNDESMEFNSAAAPMSNKEVPTTDDDQEENDEEHIGTYPFPLLPYGEGDESQDNDDFESRQRLGWGLLWATIGSVLVLVSMATIRGALRRKLKRQQLNEAVWALGTDQEVAELLKIKWRTTRSHQGSDNADVLQVLDHNWNDIYDPDDVEQPTSPKAAALAAQLQATHYLEVFTNTRSHAGYHTDDSMLHGSSMPRLRSPSPVPRHRYPYPAQ